MITCYNFFINEKKLSVHLSDNSSNSVYTISTFYLSNSLEPFTFKQDRLDKYILESDTILEIKEQFEKLITYALTSKEKFSFTKDKNVRLFFAILETEFSNLLKDSLTLQELFITEEGKLTEPYKGKNYNNEKGFKKLICESITDIKIDSIEYLDNGWFKFISETEQVCFNITFVGDIIKAKRVGVGTNDIHFNTFGFKLKDLKFVNGTIRYKDFEIIGIYPKRNGLFLVDISSITLLTEPIA